MSAAGSWHEHAFAGTTAVQPTFHEIRLRGPWRYEWTGAAASPQGMPPVGRVMMPATWQSLFDARAGSARFRRRFHRPTNLGARERVMLVFNGVGGSGQVALNEEPVGPVGGNALPERFDVTARLLPTNELTVEIEYDPASGEPGGLWGTVALEIHSD